MIPYRIVNWFLEIPYDPNNERFKNVKKPKLRQYLENKVTVEERTVENELQSCYVTDKASQDIIGGPIAARLSEEEKFVKGCVEELFPFMLGFEWTDFVNFDSPSIKEWFLNPTKEQRRLRAHVLSCLLIKLVNIEYDGFSGISDWCRLYQRLTANLGPVAKCMPKPSTVYDLVYQCMILTQSASRFRLSFLDGLGRHFTVMHSLLGIDPENSYLPSFERTVQPFVPSLVGATNMKVDSVDLGYDLFADTMHHDEIVKLSKELQHRAETIVESNLTHFMMGALDVLEKKTRDLGWFELTRHYKERSVKTVYKKGFIEGHARTMPHFALDIITNEVENANDDTNCVTALVKDIYNVSTSGKKNPGGWQAGWQANQNWFQTETQMNFSSGYLTKSSNVRLEPTTDMIFLMSHGLLYLPDTSATSTLRYFFQHGGQGTMKWKEEDHYFPNPFSNQALDPIFSHQGIVSFSLLFAFLPHIF